LRVICNIQNIILKVQIIKDITGHAFKKANFTVRITVQAPSRGRASASPKRSQDSDPSKPAVRSPLYQVHNVDDICDPSPHLASESSVTLALTLEDFSSSSTSLALDKISSLSKRKFQKNFKELAHNFRGLPVSLQQDDILALQRLTKICRHLTSHPRKGGQEK
jgi:hypothetical protein